VAEGALEGAQHRDRLQVPDQVVDAVADLARVALVDGDDEHGTSLPDDQPFSVDPGVVPSPPRQGAGCRSGARETAGAGGDRSTTVHRRKNCVEGPISSA